MEFTFSPEQDELRAAARRFLAAPPDDWWPAVVDLGWTDVPTLLDAVVLCEESGRLPLDRPWLSWVCASVLLRALGVPADARLVSVAVEEDGSRDPLAGITCSADGGRLTGVKPLVLDGAGADVVLVVARDAGGLAVYAVDAPAAEPVPTLDVERAVARLVLEGTPARRLGPPGDQTEHIRRALDDMGIALCAESVGACDRALELATEYAKARVQFGRPIATFQVIKHKIVDMLHQLELARVATHYAAWTSDVDHPDRAAAAAMCKGFVAEAATMVTGETIQIHGAVGFTWDVDCHRLFRRVKANDVLFGRQAWHRQRLADLVIG